MAESREDRSDGKKDSPSPLRSGHPGVNLSGLLRSMRVRNALEERTSHGRGAAGPAGTDTIAGNEGTEAERSSVSVETGQDGGAEQTRGGSVVFHVEGTRSFIPNMEIASMCRTQPSNSSRRRKQAPAPGSSQKGIYPRARVSISSSVPLLVAPSHHRSFPLPPPFDDVLHAAAAVSRYGALD